MKLDTTFQDMLHESYSQLYESTMSSPQRRTVASLRATGWRIIHDSESSDVHLSNGADDVYVREDGTISYMANECHSIEEMDRHIDNYHLSNVIPLIEENVSEIPEEKKRTLAENIRLLFDNLTIITLTRGNDVYVVTMSRHSNEYAKFTNDTLIESGNLHNRRTAQNLVDRLMASGFDESDWKSVIPRSVMKTARFVKSQTPTIAAIFLMYVVAPGIVTAILSFVFRLAWSVLGGILNALPFPSFQIFSDAVEEALSLLNVNHDPVGDVISSDFFPLQPQVDGFSGAAPRVDNR